MKKTLFVLLLLMIILIWWGPNNNNWGQRDSSIIKVKNNQSIKDKQNNRYYIEATNSQNKVYGFDYYYSYYQGNQNVSITTVKNENCDQNEEVIDEFLFVYYKKQFLLYPLNLLNINENPDWLVIYQLNEEELLFLKNLKIKITKIIKDMPETNQNHYHLLLEDFFFYENIQQYLLFDEIKGFLTEEEQSKWDKLNSKIEQKNDKRTNIKVNQDYWITKLVSSSLNNWQKEIAADLLKSVYLLKKLNDCEQIWANKSKEILFYNYETKYQSNIHLLKTIMEENNFYIKEREILAQLTEDRAANQLLLNNNKSFLINYHADHWQDLIYYQQIGAEALFKEKSNDLLKNNQYYSIFIKISEEKINHQLAKSSEILKILGLLPEEIIYWPEETIYQTILNLIEQQIQEKSIV